MKFRLGLYRRANSEMSPLEREFGAEDFKLANSMQYVSFNKQFKNLDITPDSGKYLPYSEWSPHEDEELIRQVEIQQRDHDSLGRLRENQDSEDSEGRLEVDPMMIGFGCLFTLGAMAGGAYALYKLGELVYTAFK